MLSLDQVFKQKLTDEDFSRTFASECHICAVTVNIIDKIENSGKDREQILASAGVTPEQYEDLKNADCCVPEIVRKLYRAVSADLPEAFQNCSKR